MNGWLSVPRWIRLVISIWAAVILVQMTVGFLFMVGAASKALSNGWSLKVSSTGTD